MIRKIYFMLIKTINRKFLQNLSRLFKESFFHIFGKLFVQ